MDLTFIFNYLRSGITRRLDERTTWDGIVLILAAITFLIFKPLATIAAYAAIVYGIWTMWRKEK
ncbi:hypothetical protein N8072_00710 [bacterium]|jgi:hypothetical protein|nr:hypothetical protein [bacterium]MDB4128472.1 hypothetical protein [bacterium]MDC1257183.1 hypothetical protein [bacterium]